MNTKQEDSIKLRELFDERKELFIKENNRTKVEDERLKQIQLEIEQITRDRVKEMEEKASKNVFVPSQSFKIEKSKTDKKPNVRGKKEEIAQRVKELQDEKISEKEIIKKLVEETGASNTYIYKIVKGKI